MESESRQLVQRYFIVLHTRAVNHWHWLRYGLAVLIIGFICIDTRSHCNSSKP